MNSEMRLFVHVVVRFPFKWKKLTISHNRNYTRSSYFYFIFIQLVSLVSR